MWVINCNFPERTTITDWNLLKEIIFMEFVICFSSEMQQIFTGVPNIFPTIYWGKSSDIIFIVVFPSCSVVQLVCPVHLKRTSSANLWHILTAEHILPCVLMPFLSPPPWTDPRKSIWRRLQIAKLFIMQVSLLPLSWIQIFFSAFCSQTLPVYVLVLEWETIFLTHKNYRFIIVCISGCVFSFMLFSYFWMPHCVPN